MDIDEATANLNFYFVALFNLEVDAPLSELVHSFGLPQEEYFQLLTLWKFIQDFGEAFVDFVVLFGNVNVLRVGYLGF